MIGIHFADMTTRNQVRSYATVILKKYDHKESGQIICNGYSQEILPQGIRSDHLQQLFSRNTTTRHQVRSSATVILKKYDHKASGQIICNNYSQEILYTIRLPRHYSAEV